MNPGHGLIKIPSIMYVIFNAFRIAIGIFMLLSASAIVGLPQDMASQADFDNAIEMLGSDFFRNAPEVTAVMEAMDIDPDALQDDEIMLHLLDYWAQQMRMFGIASIVLAIIGFFIGVMGLKNCGNLDEASKLSAIAFLGMFIESAAFVTSFDMLGGFGAIPVILMIMYFIGALKNKSAAAAIQEEI
ncbi:MAG: hypothetical protein FWE20_06250 [Defluviitaleaceae bacterium]|nr:hypothetical protein [Defluviitaleaceae bacterium]